MKTLEQKMKQAVENKTAKVLTLDLAKSLIGKRIQTIYFGYRGQDGTDDFIVGEIVSDLEYHRNLNEDCYKNNPKFKNRAEYWESYMSESEINARKNSFKLISADGRDTYIITQPNQNVFTCSDADRYVFFIEIKQEDNNLLKINEYYCVETNEGVRHLIFKWFENNNACFTGYKTNVDVSISLADLKIYSSDNFETVESI